MKRRTFIKSAAVGVGAIAVPTIVPSSVFGKSAPSNKIHHIDLSVSSKWIGHHHQQPLGIDFPPPTNRSNHTELCWYLDIRPPGCI